MRLIDADALIVELEKDEALFDKEAEKARENSDNCLENYANAMWSCANGIRDAIIEIYDAPTINRPNGRWIMHVDDLFPCESILHHWHRQPQDGQCDEHGLYVSGLFWADEP